MVITATEPAMNSAARSFRLAHLFHHVALCALALFAPAALADRSAYGKAVDLEVSAGAVTIRHHHDWSKVSQTDQGWQLHYSERRPFGVDPEDAYVAIFSPPDALVIRVPSSPLTHLSVTDDGTYVIGLSNIKFLNFTQLVVYDMRGRLLMRRRITARVHCLSIDQFNAAKLEFPEVFAALDRHTTLTQVGYGWREADVVYLELPYLTEPMADLYDALTASRCDSPYSPNFSESITNLIHWYQAEDPQPVVVEKDGRPFEVRLRDPAGLTFGVKFEQTPLTNPHD